MSCFNFGTQNYLVFQLMYLFGNTDYVLSWKSKGLSDETIKSPSTSDNSLAPSLSYYDTKTRVNFTGSWLKQDKLTYIHNNSKCLHCLWIRLFWL